jgi:CubicO group peptidase (beta-lactamase class C family)
VTDTPASVGLDPEPLDRLRRDVAEGELPNVHGILIVRDGKLVMEEYFNEFDREIRQYTASVSKSVGSMLFGIALDLGLVRGMDDRGVNVPLSQVLPEYEDLLSHPDKRKLSLRHVLTMSAGLEWDERSLPYSDPQNDWIRASRSGDPVRFVLDRPIVHPPGAVFNYNGGLSIILAHLVETRSGMRADRFAEEYLLGPLGITDYEWEHLHNGMTDTDGGLHLRPRDMAKLGQLYLNGGIWNGARIVSEEWVRASVREHIINEGSPNYGFQWWAGDFQYAAGSVFTFFASGHGGQKIFVLPDFDMVVVLTHEVFNNPMGEIRNSAILGRYVLPSADATAATTEPVELDAAVLSRYVGEYEWDQDRFSIEQRDGRLIGESSDPTPLQLTPLSTTRFRGTLMDLVDVGLEFEVADDGTVEGLRARFMFNDRRYRRVGSPD